MRIRSIKPIFWRDRDLARVGDEVRLFYVGLWMEADDAGYFRWNEDEVGADLYPYLSETARLRKVRKCTEALRAMPGAPRLQVLPCGHARLSRFLEHQKPGGGTRVVTFAHQHEQCPRLVRTNPDKSDVVGGDGMGRDGTGYTGRDAPTGASDSSKFRERMVAAGLHLGGKA